VRWPSGPPTPTIRAGKSKSLKSSQILIHYLLFRPHRIRAATSKSGRRGSHTPCRRSEPSTHALYCICLLHTIWIVDSKSIGSVRRLGFLFAIRPHTIRAAKSNSAEHIKGPDYYLSFGTPHYSGPTLIGGVGGSLSNRARGPFPKIIPPDFPHCDESFQGRDRIFAQKSCHDPEPRRRGRTDCFRGRVGRGRDCFFSAGGGPSQDLFSQPGS